MYDQSRGWFSCDAVCTSSKKDYDRKTEIMQVTPFPSPPQHVADVYSGCRGAGGAAAEDCQLASRRVRAAVRVSSQTGQLRFTALTAHALFVMQRQLFWGGVESAKGFAKRQTWWDMLFMGIRGMSRDPGLAEYFLEVLFRFLLNLILGLFGNTMYSLVPAILASAPCV